MREPVGGPPTSAPRIPAQRAGTLVAEPAGPPRHAAVKVPAPRVPKGEGQSSSPSAAAGGAHRTVRAPRATARSLADLHPLGGEGPRAGGLPTGPRPGATTGSVAEALAERTVALRAVTPRAAPRHSRPEPDLAVPAESRPVAGEPLDDPAGRRRVPADLLPVTTRSALLPAEPVRVPAEPRPVATRSALLPAEPVRVPAEPRSVAARPALVPVKPLRVPATPLPAPAEPRTTVLPVVPAARPRRTAARPNRAAPARPTEARPTEIRPTEIRPTTARPAESRPTAPEPTLARPTIARPTIARPTIARPTIARPPAARPSTAPPADATADVAAAPTRAIPAVPSRPIVSRGVRTARHTAGRPALPAPRRALDALPTTTCVVALVPAHNEEEGIVATVESLRGQERAPDRIVVVADNCTDRTVELAEAAGAEVFTTEGNTHRKAGALNAALEVLLPTLRDTDVVLAMDADSKLMPDFVGNGLHYLEGVPERGAISGSYRARDDATIVGLMQRLEYAQGLHTVHAKGGRIHVLSGAACMFSVGALRKVARLRGSDVLPGRQGLVYLPESLTEDYELTVALKRIGYEPLNARECEVETDVMGTWAAWRTQRLRWQRGTLETLFQYGWIPHTRSAWLIQLWTYFRSLVPLLMVLYWIYALSFESLTVQPFWLVVLPVFVLDQLVCSWRAGPRARLVAVALLPMYLYDAAQSLVYWRALFLSLRRARTEWIT
ncbi:glycosyltransferase [Pseudonocardia ailaonensis]|uniref:glycosyltransferase n=1 Tax=Pseudonocardia ailaonensis TaxID=367279 RepID=UPI0031E0941F